jgi:hypothetical protein
MKHVLFLTALAPLMVAQVSRGAAQDNSSVAAAAARYVPGVDWRPKSIVTGDFTCSGRSQHAILGTSQTEIIVAVFLNGTTKRPEVLRYSAKARRASSAVLTIEDLNFEPEDLQADLGFFPRGLRPSKTCKGLNLSDGDTDSAHIYWNHESRRFDDWTL